MPARIVFYIQTNEASKVERQLVELLNANVWEWSIELNPTSAEVVHDSMEVSGCAEPNWYSWHSYIPHDELYGPTLGANFIKALAVLHEINGLIESLLTSDTTTGEAGDALYGEALNIYESGSPLQPGKE